LKYYNEINSLGLVKSGLKLAGRLTELDRDLTQAKIPLTGDEDDQEGGGFESRAEIVKYMFNVLDDVGESARMSQIVFAIE
jgi:hypothetical protein